MVERPIKKTNSFQEYFTECDEIVNYMITLLEVEENHSLLEPCAGHGAFIDGLLKRYENISLDAYDINPKNIAVLKQKYLFYNLNIKCLDFLFYDTSKKYDRIIANPPYGAYQSKNKRLSLKKLYSDFYVRETYGLFLLHSLEMLDENGKLVFIIPDTYLNLHLHENLRYTLFTKYSIESITLFPSDYFPNINFGYAGLSIISIKNSPPDNNASFPVYSNLKSKKDFKFILDEKKSEYSINRIFYKDILSNPSFSVYLLKETWVSSLLNQSHFSIQNIADVVTGFYSGNDSIFLKRLPSVKRGQKKYETIQQNEIHEEKKKVPLNGIKGEKFYIPIVKGGNTRFYKPSEWFMNWSEEAVYDYRVTNRKRARFQNSQFYFQQGIAIPMVTSSEITASLIDNRLFDQSIVGLFPTDNYKHLLYYLLGFFNSEVCNQLIRTINSSVNNSANYIKKIPIIIPSNELLQKIETEVKNLLEKARVSKIQKIDLEKMNTLFNRLYKS